LHPSHHSVHGNGRLFQRGRDAEKGSIGEVHDQYLVIGQNRVLARNGFGHAKKQRAAQRKYQYLALGPFKQGLLVKGQVVCASGFMVT